LQAGLDVVSFDQAASRVVLAPVARLAMAAEVTAVTAGLGPRTKLAIRRVSRVLARGAVAVACLCAIAAVVLGFRYLVFEYNHGDRQILFRLLDSLMP
jgi:hypothetical protein